MRRATPPSLDLMAITAVLGAVRQAADAICDRWTFEILWAAFEGATRFTDFAERTGMASRLVASRLAALERLGVLVRQGYSARPPRQDYHLTPMGEALAEVIGQMWRWELSWGPLGRPPEAQAPVLTCRHCGKPATARDITPRLDERALQRLTGKTAVHRRSTLPAVGGAGDHPLARSLDIFGDKWGIEILICSFFRVRRFADFRACTGISARILGDRLARLQSLGILVPARPGAAVAGYWLTEKGIDLYGITVAVQAWADDWLAPRTRSPVTLVHSACGARFEIGPSPSPLPVGLAPSGLPSRQREIT